MLFKQSESINKEKNSASAVSKLDAATTEKFREIGVLGELGEVRNLLHRQNELDQLIAECNEKISKRLFADDSEKQAVWDAYSQAQAEVWEIPEQVGAAVLKMTQTILKLDSGNWVREHFNPYEQMVLRGSADYLASTHRSPVQKNIIEVLEASIEGRHLDEREQLTTAVADLTGEFDEKLSGGYNLKDEPFSRAKYIIEHIAGRVYGNHGERDSLARRAVALLSDEILKFCYSAIPEGYIKNRDFIKKLIETWSRGDYPEWDKISRFIKKLEKHVNDPYSDEEFDKALSERIKQTEEACGQVFKAFPQILAVGVTGTLARSDFFGFHPKHSDIDLMVYTPAPDRELTLKIERFAKEISHQMKIEVEPGGTFESMGERGWGDDYSVWDFANPQLVGQFSKDMAENRGNTLFRGTPVFDILTILAANHYRGKIINFREFSNIDFEKDINQPLKDFYEKEVIPYQRKTQARFAFLDGTADSY
jgi:predicted nucleotidyltransferase